LPPAEVDHPLAVEKRRLFDFEVEQLALDLVARAPGDELGRE
jgi:hypothetical protein